MPKFAKMLRSFREVWVVWDYKKQKIKKKLDSKGEIHYFVGYLTNHAGSVYRIYNSNTGGITTTIDTYWLNKMPNEVKSTDKIKKNEADDKSDEETEDKKS